MQKENKDDTNEYLISFFYAVLIFILISEPFVFQITNKEYIRMYAVLLSFIGIIVLSIMLNSKKGVKNKK